MDIDSAIMKAEEKKEGKEEERGKDKEEREEKEEESVEAAPKPPERKQRALQQNSRPKEESAENPVKVGILMEITRF